MIIRLIKTDSELLETVGTSIDGKYFHIPFWYKKIDEGLYEEIRFENLPDELKDRIKQLTNQQ